MDFDFSDDQKLLKDHLGKYLAAECPISTVRKVLDGEEVYSKNVWQGLADMGLMGTALPENYGGTGAGYLELCVAAEELGRSVAAVPFGSTVYLLAEAILAHGTDQQKQAYLPGIASGTTIGAVGLTENLNGVAGQAQVSVVDGRIQGQKLPVPDGSIADVALIRDNSGNNDSLYLVDLNDSGVSRETLESIDPTRDMASIKFDGVAAEPLGAAGQGQAILSSLQDRAAVLQSFEQLGGASHALDMAVEYAKERFAFGRPIGSFQALKHMIADMYVAAELARSNCYYAAWALSTDADELPLAAATARVSATRAYQLCAKDNIQVHGGMGFTWEVNCHLFYRRANFQALELGSLSTWEDRLVNQLEAQQAA